MAVFLSPVGGAGAQFFDNNGNPLSGGKLYTYAAGTTTPQATYTSTTGTTFHSNPIVLDAGGRVPNGGEIWLADSAIYKFVLKTSTDVLLATWDQITGVNSNFVNFTTETEIQTATDGQTVFTLTTMTYSPGTGNLTVYIDGVNQYEGTSYVETDGTTVTFTSGLHVGAEVKFTTAVQTTGNATDASVVSYTAPYTGAVAYTVEDKLAQTISVKDFGAVGDGITDDFLAINTAVKAAADLGGATVYYPAGTYLISRAIRLDDFDVETNTYSGNTRYNITHKGDGPGATTIKAGSFYASIFTSFPEPFIPSGDVNPPADPGNLLCSGVVIRDMTLDCDYDTVVDGGDVYGTHYETAPEATAGWPNGYIGPSYWGSDNFQYPIYMYYGENLQVLNCVIKNTWMNGVEFYASSNAQITNNTFQHCGDKANVYGYYSAMQFDQRSNTISVIGNIVTDCGNGIMSVSGVGAFSPVHDVLISNNTFTNIGPGNGVQAVDYLDKWVITSNTFSNMDNQGIALVNNQPSWPGTDLPKNCIIANNTIDEFNLDNNTSVFAIRVLGHNMAIQNNIIKQTDASVTATTAGIYTTDSGVTPGANDSKGMTVSGNTLMGVFPGTNASHGVLHISSDNTLVAGNTIRSTGASAQTAITLFGENAVVTGNNIVGGYVEGGKAIYLYTGSANTFISDNKYAPETAIHTTAASSSISGANNVPFSTLSTTVDIDNRGNFDTATDYISIDVPGIYELSGVARVTAASASSVIGYIEQNSSTVLATSEQTASAGGTVTVVMCGIATLAAPDTIRLKVNVPTGNYVIESFSSLSAKFIRQTT